MVISGFASCCCGMKTLGYSKHPPQDFLTFRPFLSQAMIKNCIGENKDFANGAELKPSNVQDCICKSWGCKNVNAEKENSLALESPAALSDCPLPVDSAPLLFFFPQPVALTRFPGDRKWPENYSFFFFPPSLHILRIASLCRIGALIVVGMRPY